MKKRFNIIDVLIIACAVLIVFSIIFRGQIISFFGSTQNLDAFTVVFESDPVDNRIITTLKSGQSVTWVENSKVLGTLAEFEVTEATVYTVQTNGTLIQTKSDSQSVIRGTLDITAALRDGACYVSGTNFLGGGMNITLRTEYATFTVTVISVNA